MSRAELLTRFDAAGVEELLTEPLAPLMLVQVRHLGGALAGPTKNPHGSLSEPFALYMFGVPTDAAAAAGSVPSRRRWIRGAPSAATSA
ncbi:hypothetical protein GCM10028820_11360 [Tessaracoccus terricola]